MEQDAQPDEDAGIISRNPGSRQGWEVFREQAVDDARRNKEEDVFAELEPQQKREE